MKKIGVVLILVISISGSVWGTLALATLSSQSQPYRSFNSGLAFFPPYASDSERLGYGKASSHNTTNLNAGWYLDWNAHNNPAHPAGAEYARLIYLNTNRPFCQAATSMSQVTPTLTGTALINAVQLNPGALWLVGNEPDSLYNGAPLQPSVYAELYHYFVTTIKETDPTAKVSPAAIVQPSPARLAYLDKILNHYQTTFGEPLPADLWNIHFYILNEGGCGTWGAAVPAGHEGGSGWQISFNAAALLDINRAEENLRAFRQWMHDRGYQNIPLLITEYGVLPPPTFAGFSNEAAAQFLNDTQNLFMTLTDPEIGYPDDDHRLVQKWAWFSTYVSQYGGDLYVPNTSDTLSVVGEAFANQTATSFQPYVNLQVAPPRIPTDISDNLIAADAFISNRGNVTATDTQANIELIDFVTGQVIDSETINIGSLNRRYGHNPLPIFKTWPITAPYAYTITINAISQGDVADADLTDNQLVRLEAVYPDLSLSNLVTVLESVATKGDMVEASTYFTVTNKGLYPSEAQPLMFTVQQVGRLSVIPSTVITVPALSANQSFSSNIAWQVANDGEFQILAQLDTQTVLDLTTIENQAIDHLSIYSQPEIRGRHTAKPSALHNQQPVIFTVSITNIGLLSATNTTILSDLPPGFKFNGPIQIEPDQPLADRSSQTSDLPILVANLTLNNTDRLTITIPLLLDSNSLEGTTITHTISITSSNLDRVVYLQTPVYISQTVTGVTDPSSLYFPLLQKSTQTSEVPVLSETVKVRNGIIKRDVSIRD
ncbi:MAG: hypothetical protein AAF629_27855 [Chloroflexota bacterium]